MQTAEYHRQWRERHKERLREYHRERRRKEREANGDAVRADQRAQKNTPDGRASRLYYGARTRAQKADLEFTLDIEWVKERVRRGTCVVTGLPFTLESGRHAFAPSLDRIDPTKGYTPENVQVVLWCYNAAKGVASHDQVMVMALALAQTYAGVEA